MPRRGDFPSKSSTGSVCLDAEVLLSVKPVCCSQHDAHEFLIYLLEGLHEDVNRVRVKKKRVLDSSNEVEHIG